MWADVGLDANAATHDHHHHISCSSSSSRFAGAVAKRLTSLGALLRGDRRALGASSDLKPYDVDNRYGEAAVQRVLECVANGVHTVAGSKPGELPADLLPPDVAATPPGSVARQRAFMGHMQRCLRSMGLLTVTTYPGGHVAYSVERKDQATGVPKFLNRLLGLPLRDQDLLFGYFLDIMDSLVKQARSAGDYDEAIVNIGHSAVKVVAQHTVHTDAPSGATTSYMELDVDDGLSWADACAALAAAREDMAAERAPARVVNKVGFYVARRNANVGGTGHPLVVLATAMRQTVLGSRLQPRFRIQRPNQVKGYTFTLHELEDKYRKVDEQTAELHWAFWYAYLDGGCLHGGECVRRKRDGRCNYGSRFYRLHLVTGAVLPVLRKLFDTVLRGGGGSNGKKQAPRVVRATIREQGQQQPGAGGQGPLLLEGPEAAAAREKEQQQQQQEKEEDKKNKQEDDDDDVVEVVEVVAPVKREGERTRARKGRALRATAGSAAAAANGSGTGSGSAGAGPSGSQAPALGAGGSSAAATGGGAAAVPGAHAHAGVAGEGGHGHDPNTRVVVGLSLTERDAEQFLQAVML
ncbi:hypothetical protein HYH02_015212 [Chlamydomonas schloesseri]|uniref:Uncharacterized protein n=1 Tax=Chlamydomonas schloesseri TaxID=2026947 RepID=A0A835VPC0_9CHLO|nr:hypothetical protein HYH02_015212 [Chlamydomonas schloesseri]|eukprot:KAG2424227.1 hypothetical protein HYH02_015212 [Chlamydomonas schloesseri]